MHRHPKEVEGRALLGRASTFLYEILSNHGDMERGRYTRFYRYGLSGPLCGTRVPIESPTLSVLTDSAMPHRSGLAGPEPVY